MSVADRLRVFAHYRDHFDDVLCDGDVAASAAFAAADTRALTAAYGFHSAAADGDVTAGAGAAAAETGILFSDRFCVENARAVTAGQGLRVDREAVAARDIDTAVTRVKGAVVAEDQGNVSEDGDPAGISDIGAENIPAGFERALTPVENLINSDRLLLSVFVKVAHRVFRYIELRRYRDVLRRHTERVLTVLWEDNGVVVLDIPDRVLFTNISKQLHFV